MTTRRERFLAFGKTLLAKLFASLQRFPETLFFCAATVVVLIYLNHGEMGVSADPGGLLQRLAAVLALGIPLSLCLKVLFERATFLKAPLKLLIYTVAAAGLVLFYFFQLKDFEMISQSRYVAISLALYLAFTFIPYFYRRQNYELYVIKLFISLVITYLFAFVLLGGLAAILATINYLFSAGIPGPIYTDIWLITGGIFAPALFLAEIPESGEEPAPESYPRVISALLSYIVMPLILVYCAILYIYFIRMLVMWQWPEIMVSHLVLWYAIICTLVLFCIRPLQQASRWIKSFTSFFPKILLPLLVLMLVAMGIRVGAYGITENRYFVLAAGLWITGSMLYLIFSRSPRNALLSASLALVTILSVYGPWSSYSVSVISQNRHFEKVAAEYDLIRDGEIVKPAAALSKTAQDEISSIIIYFNLYHGLDRLRALPEGFEINEMEALFGFPLHEYELSDDEQIYFHHILAENETFFEISGFDYFMQLSPVEQRYSAGELEVFYSPEDDELKITLRGEPVYSQNIADIAVKLHRDSAGKGNRDSLSREEMTFAERRGSLRLLYVFKAIGGWEKKSTDVIMIEHMDINLFVGLETEGSQTPE